MAAGFRNPVPVPTLGASAPVPVQAGMTSMIAPWMGGRVGAVAVQAGMTSMIAPWMGGRIGAVAVIPPPPPPPPAPSSGGAGLGGSGGGSGWYDHDHSLRRLLDEAWERGRLKRVAPSAKPVAIYEPTTDTADSEPQVETIHHHHWWVIERKVEVDRPVVVERFIDKSTTTVVTKTVTTGVDVIAILSAIGLFAVSALSTGLAIRETANRGLTLKTAAYVGLAASTMVGGASLWRRRRVVGSDVKVETIQKPAGFSAMLSGFRAAR